VLEACVALQRLVETLQGLAGDRRGRGSCDDTTACRRLSLSLGFVWRLSLGVRRLEGCQGCQCCCETLVLLVDWIRECIDALVVRRDGL
jgi:hypothetical protein